MAFKILTRKIINLEPWTLAYRVKWAAETPCEWQQVLSPITSVIKQLYVALLKNTKRRMNILSWEICPWWEFRTHHFNWCQIPTFPLEFISKQQFYCWCQRPGYSEFPVTPTGKREQEVQFGKGLRHLFAFLTLGSLKLGGSTKLKLLPFPGSPSYLKTWSLNLWRRIKDWGVSLKRFYIVRGRCETEEHAQDFHEMLLIFI